MKTSLALSLALLALAGCTDTRPGIEGVQSIRVDMVTPADPGAIDRRLADSAHDITVNLQALDQDGNEADDFDATIKVYAQFLGTLTPELQKVPLHTIEMVGGKAENASFTLPDAVLGPTTVWFDNGTGVETTYVPGAVAGTSPTLWYRDPFIQDIQRPRDETALDALTVTPLTDKQVTVSASRHGANGRMVVTSTFAQGYTVSDVKCGAGGTPPCTAEAYDHVMVFSFSAPRDETTRPLEVGDVIRRFNGGVTEFNGLTEIGFPRSFVTDADNPTLVNNPALLPPPALVDVAWFKSDFPTGRINFERNEGGPIEIRNGKVCELDENYTTYKQWRIDPAGASGTCGRDVINLITQGSDFTTDPATLVGRVIPSVVGILRPVNIGSFNVWIVYPRGASDIRL